MMDWLRWYHGTVTDPKWRVITRRAGVRAADVVAVWALMLENASSADARGGVRGTLTRWNDEDAAAVLDLEPEQVAAIRAAMQGKVLDGERLSGWEHRQPKRERVDPSADRVRRFRERLKEGEKEGGNATVTPVERPRVEEKREEEKQQQTTVREPAPAPEPAALPSANGNGSRPSSAEGVPPGRPADPPSSAANPADLAVMAANRGMMANPRLASGFNPIACGQGKSVQQVHDWQADGIPIDLILRVVHRRAADYEPDGRHRQIVSLKYFDAAVREAHDRAALEPVPGTEAERVAKGKYSETPGGGRAHQPRKAAEPTPLRDVAVLRELREKALGKRPEPVTTARGA